MQLMIRFVTSLILVLLIYLSLNNSIMIFFLLMLITFLALSEFWQLFKKIFKSNHIYLFLTFFLSLIYLSTFSLFIWNYLIPLNNINTISLIFILVICASTDIGGYIFGKLIGGKKITSISPQKTYSGVIGSFIFALSLGYLFYNFFMSLMSIDINFIMIVIIVSLISQIGDLFISLLKRKAKVKDTGSILPGHGGILDRIDGILIALPIGIKLISI